jgi:hypothetical protein
VRPRATHRDTSKRAAAASRWRRTRHAASALPADGRRENPKILGFFL